MKQLTLLITVVLLSGCSMGIERGGANINDALSEGAKIYRAEIAQEHALLDYASMRWVPMQEEVPCRVINYVEYDIGFSKISLGLIAHQYGGKYFPKPPGLGGLLRIKEWVKPTLLVEADRNNDGVSDIEKSEAELIASHCEVRFRNAR